MNYSESSLICTPNIWAPPLLGTQYFLLGGLNVEFELMGLVVVPQLFSNHTLRNLPNSCSDNYFLQQNFQNNSDLILFSKGSFKVSCSFKVKDSLRVMGGFKVIMVPHRPYRRGSHSLPDIHLSKKICSIKLIHGECEHICREFSYSTYCAPQIQLKTVVIKAFAIHFY